MRKKKPTLTRRIERAICILEILIQQEQRLLQKLPAVEMDTLLQSMARDRYEVLIRAYQAALKLLTEDFDPG